MIKERPKVGVAVIIRNNDKVLLGKRKGSHGDGYWAVPGGHLEFGEGVEGCAIREVAEEAGIKIKNLKRACFTNDVFIEDDKHYVTLMIISDHESGEPQLMEPEKCEGWGWFSWDDLPKPLFLPLENLIKEGFNPFEY